MPIFRADHLIVNGRTTSYPYTSKVQFQNRASIRTGLNRVTHGRSIRNQLNQAVSDFELTPNDQFVYVVFKSAPDFLLDLKKLEDTKGNFKLRTTRQIEVEDPNGDIQIVSEAAVYLNRRAIGMFLKKVDEYMRRDKDTKKGNPRHQSLIANIDEIKAATLQSFWQEPELPFPDLHDRQWWEVWISKDPADRQRDPIASLRPLLAEHEVQIGSRHLVFPEHYIYLMRATVEQLSNSILYTERVSELRKPRDTADFFSYLPVREQQGWINDLRSRVNFLPDDVSVCLLDSGVTINNPLLANIIDPQHLTSINPRWNTHDHFADGHGTPMAGLAIYGDLTDLLGTTSRIDITHKLESVKIYAGNGHAPELRGAITKEAVARMEILNPNHNRIFCLAITSWDLIHKGCPSSWSSAIDQLLFGSPENPNTNILFMISAGNLDLDLRLAYPLSNEQASIEDPAQSYNAIAVGAYTLKDRMDQQRYPNGNLLAARGALAPCSRTSEDWDNQWCRKPDIVMEGGNHGIHQNVLLEDRALQLLSTSTARLNHSPLLDFADTSAATALASRFAAKLYREYPNLWPETIRGLIIHSAEWTPAMRRNRSIQLLTTGQKVKLFRQVGYGVPNMDRARYSAFNSVSLIAERRLKPYKLEGSVTKTDEFHLFELPWPEEALQQLFNTEITLKVTLSYFIEPNPGNKLYEQAASYMSHGLRFKMIDNNESSDAFLARISKAMEDEEYEAEGRDNWVLGERVRNKGSVHKDLWIGSAVDLANRNQIAIHPVGGWWRSRKHLGRYDNSIRYSLIVTIEAPDNINNLDIYTPVLNQIDIDIDI